MRLKGHSPALSVSMHVRGKSELANVVEMLERSVTYVDYTYHISAGEYTYDEAKQYCEDLVRGGRLGFPVDADAEAAVKQ